MMTGDSTSRYYLDLVNTLAELFEDKPVIKGIAKDAGLDWKDVDPDGSVKVHWQSVVSVARHQRKVRSLLEQANQQYPNNAELARLQGKFDPSSEYQDAAEAFEIQPSNGFQIDGDCSNSVVLSQITVLGGLSITQGLSDGPLRELISRIPPHNDTPIAYNEDLIWGIVDQIKEARVSLAQKKERTLVARIRELYESTGTKWSRTLRMETLLILAEEERVTLLKAKSARTTLDTRELKRLLGELRDV